MRQKHKTDTIMAWIVFRLINDVVLIIIVFLLDVILK
jgi:hypothetical protein